MKTHAWQFSRLGGPEVLSLDEQDLSRPGPGEALIAIDAIGLNRSDLLYLAGRYLSQPPQPSFLGQEAVGRVVALGPAADDAAPPTAEPIAVGDTVALMAGRVDYGGMGSYRTHGVYPVSALLPWPTSLSAAEAAGLWVAALTAQGGLRTGGLTPETAAGKTVAVTAASSGVGIVALQIARAWGARTIATTTSVDKAAALGAHADHVVVAPDAEALADGILAATGGTGVDLSFDPVGFAYTDALFRAAAVDGHVVCYGIMAGAEAAFDLISMLRKDLGVHGFTIYRLLRHPERLRAAIDDTRRLVEAGQLRPVIAQTFPFDRADSALQAMVESGHLGKLVIEVG